MVSNGAGLGTRKENSFFYYSAQRDGLLCEIEDTNRSSDDEVVMYIYIYIYLSMCLSICVFVHVYIYHDSWYSFFLSQVY